MTEEAKGKRLYLVSERKTGEYDLPNHIEKLIEASSQAQAIKIAFGDRFTAKPATARDVQRIMATNKE